MESVTASVHETASMSVPYLARSKAEALAVSSMGDVLGEDFQELGADAVCLTPVDGLKAHI